MYNSFFFYFIEDKALAIFLDEFDPPGTPPEVCLYISLSFTFPLFTSPLCLPLPLFTAPCVCPIYLFTPLLFASTLFTFPLVYSSLFLSIFVSLSKMFIFSYCLHLKLCTPVQFTGLTVEITSVTGASKRVLKCRGLVTRVGKKLEYKQTYYFMQESGEASFPPTPGFDPLELPMHDAVAYEDIPRDFYCCDSKL